MSRQTMEIIFPIDGAKPSIRSDIKREFWEETLGSFLQDQIGKGTDPNPSTTRDEYHITIQLEVDGDTFYSQHDCGNLDLRDGILLTVLRKISTGDVIDTSETPR